MADFHKDQIDALLRELRDWDPSGDPLNLDELARRHQLDPMIVRRIAESEEVDLKNGDGVPDNIDEDVDTEDIDTGPVS